MIEGADDSQFERLMRAVEASPETRASRWLEYGEDGWACRRRFASFFHETLLDRIGFEVRDAAECALEDFRDGERKTSMAEWYESPASIRSAASGMPLPERIRWLEAAAMQGDPKAQYDLADALTTLNMDVTPQSMRWVICSAASGNPEACSAVACCILSRGCCLDLVGRKASAEDALKLMWYAAVKGEWTAQSNMASLGQNGICDFPHSFYGPATMPAAGQPSSEEPMLRDLHLEFPKAVKRRLPKTGKGQSPLGG